ncbi:MAG: hypothetical protein OEY59_03970 [Deltaproteobacteria bacterium]|nr:hypothetical protein [Deltaproteobacteria bacterium]
MNFVSWGLADPSKRIGYLLLFFLLLSKVVIAAETVAIPPFVNSRMSSDEDWIGFYIKDRLTANYKNNTDWHFNSDSALRLWHLKTKKTKPINAFTNILIGGSFQKVLKYGQIIAHVTRVKDGKVYKKTFKEDFEFKNLPERIDYLSQRIGSWIEPGYRSNPLNSFLKPNIPKTIVFYRLKAVAFSGKHQPTLKDIKELNQMITPYSHHIIISQLAEMMIQYAEKQPTEMKDKMLEETERKLKKALRKYPNVARLYSLLAECYFLMGKNPDFVTKAAMDALNLDMISDTAYLILALNQGLDKKAAQPYLKRLAGINPWIWPTSNEDHYQYQQGIFTKTLLKYRGFWKNLIVVY